MAVVGDDSCFLGATSDSDSSASVTSVEYLSTAASILRISALLRVVAFSGVVEFVLRSSAVRAVLFTLSMGKDLALSTCSFSEAGGKCIVVFEVGGGKGSVPGPDDACDVAAAV